MMRPYRGSMLERAVTALYGRGEWTTAMELGDCMNMPDYKTTSERNTLSRALLRGVRGDLIERRETTRAVGSPWEYRLKCSS